MEPLHVDSLPSALSYPVLQDFNISVLPEANWKKQALCRAGLAQ